VQPACSVACEVFSESIPSSTVAESEAKLTEDILTASANENQETAATITITETVQIEATVSATPAAEADTTEANDAIVVEENAQPEAPVAEDILSLKSMMI
jgi:hypothetical protein